MPPAPKANNGSSVASAKGARQWRKLRGYAFDPILSQQFETAGINEIVFRAPWEPLTPGPIGDYLEVIDYDPASKAFYEPVNLDDPSIVGGDGLDPDESNPQFHQQFVYAVTMTTIRNFEQALGRRVFWTRRDEKRPRANGNRSCRVCAFIRTRFGARMPFTVRTERRWLSATFPLQAIPLVCNSPVASFSLVSHTISSRTRLHIRCSIAFCRDIWMRPIRMCSHSTKPLPT